MSPFPQSREQAGVDLGPGQLRQEHRGLHGSLLGGRVADGAEAARRGAAGASPGQAEGRGRQARAYSVNWAMEA